ncbi:DUF3800 domain-containing protein [Nitratireductor sp. XY-223]|uniref:DUF3800 domain-containing protein n=1 Tax=Nitratireductor sp. XY-223 TaxID=2561926 RepID=UPI0010AA2469|nr:DUF3800 domain-containing protein [Nitratireductor sp. XY-223]
MVTEKVLELKTRFTVFIDESGEAGIGKVRDADQAGASPYMTLGASLMRNRSLNTTKDALSKIEVEVGKELHCSRLNHYQLLHCARSIAKRKMRLFGVISKKSTLGDYRKRIGNAHTMYYNKCAQYLLERVGWFMHARGIPPENLDIVFEEAKVDYEMMKNLLRACQRNPRRRRTGMLQNIDVDRIVSRKKGEEPLLKIADLVAHALYRCVDKNSGNHHFVEPRYLRQLSDRFFGHPDTNMVVDAGIYCVHTTDQLSLDADVKEMLDKMESIPPRA